MKQRIYHSILSILSILFFGLALFSCTEDEEVAGGSVERVSLKSLPKVNYVLGHSLDLSEAVVVLHQSAGETEVPFSSFAQHNITVSPNNGSALDFENQFFEIVHTPSGKGLTQAIAVTNNVVEINVKKAPLSSYYHGDVLELDNLVLSQIKEDGSSEDLNFADFKSMVSCLPENGAVLSTENEEVSFVFESTGATTTQALDVKPFSPQGFTLLQAPTKDEYDIGDFLDLAGLEIEATMQDGVKKSIVSENFERYGITTSPQNEDKLNASNNTVTVAFNNLSLDVPLTINPLQVTGMTLKLKPNKTKYVAGDVIDLSGALVTLNVEGLDDINVAAADFATYGIVCTPAIGEAYTSDMTEIVISYPGYDGSIIIPLGSVIMYESDFAANGTAGWSWNQNGGGSVDVSIVDGELVADNIVPGVNKWDVQLLYPNLNFEQGETYKYTVTLKAAPNDGGRQLAYSAGDGDGRHGWAAYHGYAGVWLGANEQYQTVTKEFVMSRSSTNAGRLCFEIGHGTKGIVIKYVKIEKL